MAVHRFQTVLGAEGSEVFIEIPLDVPALFRHVEQAVAMLRDGRRAP
jgi:hypothetical protein